MEDEAAAHHSPGAPGDDRASRFEIIVVAPASEECFELTSRYVELVWSEFLGPTTTLLARRIGLSLATAGPATGLLLVEVGSSLGVAPSRVRWSLHRLAGFGIVGVSLAPAAVVTSGLAVPVPPHLAERLSAAGLVEHRRQSESRASGRLGLPASGRRLGGVARRQKGRQL
jgi:hypothetical protein